MQLCQLPNTNQDSIQYLISLQLQDIVSKDSPASLTAQVTLSHGPSTVCVQTGFVVPKAISLVQCISYRECHTGNSCMWISNNYQDKVSQKQGQNPIRVRLKKWPVEPSKGKIGLIIDHGTLKHKRWSTINNWNLWIHCHVSFIYIFYVIFSKMGNLLH